MNVPWLNREGVKPTNTKVSGRKTDPVKFALENNVNMTCCLNLGYSVSLEDLTDGKKEASLQSHKCYSKGYI